MSSMACIRHARRFCTSTSTISISAAKARLRSEHDPDKALAIYSSVSDRYKSPISSRYAQDLTVKRLAKSRRFGDIEALIESHKKDPKISQEPFLATLIRSYGLAGMTDHALRTFEQMDELGTKRSAISFNALLSAFNQCKKFDQVPKMFYEIPQKYNVSPDKISYGIFIKSLCEVGSPESAFPILKEMEEKGIEVTAITFTTILDSLYKNNKIDQAETIWNEMVEKGSPDVCAYNVKIMQAHHGKPEDVLALIEEMNAVGLKPDTISYNYLLTCYCKHGLIEDAKKVYDGLEENGCAPNAATFRTFIYHLCRNGNFNRAFEVYKESVSKDKIPDFGTMRHLVEGLVKNSKVKEAKGVIRTVKKKFPPNFQNAWKKLEVTLGLKTDEEMAAS
ncbi:pentatricopeptide repeat-containing protein At4g36680, mitochondrial-like [Macadamia integrifolia]|uniref:pentatricopeptide repeat-containing protein At4g36680, mitochondrial-like n=1 Tax=Macadamia integrifolia TaxID=60698 RepID=UPI001C4E4252|nr:pentatricopeptide repeat-containing protein At4g36680, mitochondrial-like [Macadamia integrifolia]